MYVYYLKTETKYFFFLCTPYFKGWLWYFVGHLIKLERDRVTFNMFKQTGVVASLSCGVTGIKNPVKSSLVTMVKKVCLRGQQRESHRDW